MSHDVSVGIEHADGRYIGGGQPFLPPRFAQQSRRFKN